MIESWVDIRGYKGLYQVSNFGRIKSVARKTKYAKGFLKTQPEKILVQSRGSLKTSACYYRVSLSKDNDVKQFAVHRLVAEHFLLNPEQLPQVNHKDGNKFNNRADNLEWVTPKENKLHAVYTGLDVPRYGIKPVICMTNGKLYPSASEAARALGICDSSVAKVCRGVYRDTKGMVFRYAE